MLNFQTNYDKVSLQVSLSEFADILSESEKNIVEIYRRTVSETVESLSEFGDSLIELNLNPRVKNVKSVSELGDPLLKPMMILCRNPERILVKTLKD